VSTDDEVSPAKLSQQQLVEPSPEVSGLALVGGFFVVSKVNLKQVAPSREAVSVKCT
jgi:hypothetical protein